MKKITWTWKKIVTLICGALGIGTLVSCYGVVNPTEEIFSLSGTIVDEADNPIKGIKVSAGEPHTQGEDEESHDFDCYKTTYSNDDGTYSLSWSSYGLYSVNVYVEDIDGEENGSFNNKLFEIDYSNVEGKGVNNTNTIRYEIKDKKLQLTKKTDNEDTNE